MDFALIIVLAVIAAWGLFTGAKACKSPPPEMRFFGICLRAGLITGSLVCLVAAVMLIIR